MCVNASDIHEHAQLLAEMCGELSVGDMYQSVDSTPLENIVDNQVCP